jgi:hypothetical protein
MGAYAWVGYALEGAATIAAGVEASKRPRMPAPPVMPDQNSVLQAQQLQESKQAALQYGRAATVLTGTGATGQSTTGDRLGP